MIRDQQLGDLIKDKRFQIILVVGILVLAAAVRFYKLGEWSFWIEEHHTVRHSLDLEDRAPVDVFFGRTLFYFGIRQIFDLVGINEVTARIGPALIGIFTIPFVYIVTQKQLGFRVAVFTAILLAIAPWHVYWSQNARFYTLVLFLYFSSLLSFFWWIETKQVRYLVIAMTTLVFVSLIQLITIALVLVVLSYIILLKILPFGEAPAIRTRTLVLIVAILLAGYVLFEAYNFYAHDTLITSTLYSKFFNESTRTFIGSANPYITLTAVIYHIGVPLSVLALVGSVHLVVERNRFGLLLSLGAFLPLILVMGLTLIASVSDRYMFMTVACWIILAAAGLDRLLIRASGYSNPILATIVVVIFLALARDPAVEDLVHYAKTQAYLLLPILLLTVLLGIGLLWFWRLRGGGRHRLLIYGLLGLVFLHPILVDNMYYQFQHGHRDDWKAAVEVVEHSKVDGDIVAASGPGASVAEYYMGEHVAVVDATNLDSFAQEKGRIWLFEDYVLRRDLDERIDQWITNCDEEGSWDKFTAGRFWPMRVYLCD